MSMVQISMSNNASPVAFDPLSAVLHNVLAGELREIRTRLEALAEVLVCDEYFATNFLEQLQSFDYLVQHADECAGLLDRFGAGESAHEAIQHIRLGAVQERLRQALGS
jgi:hypothetical protein